MTKMGCDANYDMIHVKVFRYLERERVWARVSSFMSWGPNKWTAEKPRNRKMDIMQKGIRELLGVGIAGKLPWREGLREHYLWRLRPDFGL